MTIEQIRETLRRLNPKANLQAIELYAQNFLLYQEATENIQQNGAIVSHPRTGQPMENPYLKVQATSEARLQKMHRMNSNELWQVQGVQGSEINRE
jgi:phage terminase small subunit